MKLRNGFQSFFNHHPSLISDNPTLHYTSPNLNLAFNMHPCLHCGEGHPKHLDKSVKSSQHQLNFSTSHISKENTVKLPPKFTRNLLQYLNLTNPNVSFWECFRDFLSLETTLFSRAVGNLNMFFCTLDSLQVFVGFFWLQILFWKIHENSLSTSPCSFFSEGGGVFPDLERLQK